MLQNYITDHVKLLTGSLPQSVIGVGAANMRGTGVLNIQIKSAVISSGTSMQVAIAFPHDNIGNNLIVSYDITVTGNISKMGGMYAVTKTGTTWPSTTGASDACVIPATFCGVYGSTETHIRFNGRVGCPTMNTANQHQQYITFTFDETAATAAMITANIRVHEENVQVYNPSI